MKLCFFSQQLCTVCHVVTMVFSDIESMVLTDVLMVTLVGPSRPRARLGGMPRL